MLSWFLDKDVVLATQNGKLVQEDDVECRPERVPNSVLDKNIDVFFIRKYFSTDAWLMVESILERKKIDDVWMCDACHRDLHSEPSIICESCLTWYHFRCVGLTKHPKIKNWFCRSCHL